MSTKGLRRHYRALTPEERFRLDVLAMARGDQQESRRLTDTCPRRDYIMNDWGFVGRWEAARELALLAFMDLARCTDKVRMIEAFRLTFPYLRAVWENDAHAAYLDGHRRGSSYAWGKAGMEGEPPGWESDEEAAERNADPAMDGDLERWSGKVDDVGGTIADKLDELQRELVRGGLSVWVSFRGFCEEEMGLEALKLLAALARPAEERARELKDVAARLGAKLDPDEVAEHREVLVQAWRRVLDKAA